MNRTHQ